METSRFMKKYKRRQLVSFIIWGALLIYIVIGVVNCKITYENNTNNPTIIKNIEDFNKAIGNADYINMEVDDYIDLGSVETTRRRSKSIKYYIGINIDQKLLLTSLNEREYENFVGEYTGTYLLKGTFGKINSNLRETIEELLEDEISAEELDLIMYQDFLSYEEPIDVLTVNIFGIILLIILSCMVMFTLIKNAKNLKNLRKYSGDNFEMICEQIDTEMQSSTAYKKGPITITQNYIVASSLRNYFAFPIKELMWTYKGVTRYYRIIRKANITCVFSNKHKYTITAISGNNSDKIIEYIAQNHKECMTGYSDELNKMYRKQPDTFVQQWKMDN